MSGDDILARAKLLAQAANQVAEQMSNQVSEYKAVVDARKAQDATHAAIEADKKAQHDNDKVVTMQDVGSFKGVKGAAINGSSLVTTYEDIRPLAPRGSMVVIDKIQCKLKMNGQWTASRVELESDFPGETNLDAEIKVAVTADTVKRRSPKKNKAAPVSSSDIMGAVAGLGSGPLLTDRSSSSKDGRNSHQQRKKSKIPAKKKSADSDTSSYSTLSSSSLSRHKRASSPTGSVLSTARSVVSTATRTTNYMHSPPKSEYVSRLPVTIDNTMEPAQIQMAAEIDSLSPEQQRQMRIDMNVRMADRGQQKAAERVKLYKHTEEEEEVFGGGSDFGVDGDERLGRFVPADEVERRRLAALRRVAEKRREEDRLIAEKLKAEEEERKELKKRMEVKAEKLKAATAQRVAAYKAAKREKIRKEKEEEAARLAQRQERAMETQSEMYLKKLQMRAMETEARLQKQKKDMEEQKYLEKLRMEEKLSSLAEERQRTKNAVNFKDLASGSVADSSVGNSSLRSKQKKPRNLPNLDLKKTAAKKSSRKGRGGGAPQPQDGDDNSEDDNAAAVVVSVQAGGPMGFLPAIRTSTSEQSARVHSVYKQPPQSPARQPPVSPVSSPTARRSSRPSARPPLAPPPVQPPRHHYVEKDDDDDDDDEFWSDDSLQRDMKPIARAKHGMSRQQQEDEIAALIANDPRDLPASDNMTCVSALTADTEAASFATGTTTASGSKKKKKKKKEVWKMQPIAISKAYVPVAGKEEDIRAF